MPYKEGAEDFEALGQPSFDVEREGTLRGKVQSIETKGGIFRQRATIEILSLVDPKGVEVASEEREKTKELERRTRKNTRGEVTGVTEFSLGQDGVVEEMRRLDSGTGRMTERISKFGSGFFSRSIYGQQGEQKRHESYDAQGKLFLTTDTEYMYPKGEPAGKRSETEFSYDMNKNAVTKKSTYEYHDPKCRVMKRIASVEEGMDHHYDNAPDTKYVSTSETTYDKKGRQKASMYKRTGDQSWFSNTVSIFAKGNKTRNQPNTEINLGENGDVLKVTTDKKYDKFGREISHTILNPDGIKVEEVVLYEGKERDRYASPSGKQEVRKTREELWASLWKGDAKARQKQE